MIIDKTEIAKHREVSRSVKDDKINPFISDAEKLDLKPLLGSEFYYDMLQNSDDVKYQNIMNPIEYKHEGLKKVLSLFSYARYVLFGSFTDTSFGFVQKSSQDSQPVSNEHKRNINKKDRQAAMQYFKEVSDYLDANRDVYPLWRKGCSSGGRGRLRISKIS